MVGPSQDSVFTKYLLLHLTYLYICGGNDCHEMPMWYTAHTILFIYLRFM